MGLLLVIALASGAIAFLMATLALMSFGVTALKHVFGRRPPVVKRYLSWGAVALACLGTCALLSGTQPVEWPWSPWQIPVCLVVIFVCRAAFAKAKVLEQAQANQPAVRKQAP